MRTLYSFAAAAAVAAAAPASALPQCANSATGADVIVGSVSGVSNSGAVSGIAGYSLGTTSCNTGDEELLWFANSTNHPVIGQNIYRLENGRFEMLGMSWLKHGFTALQQNLCCSCISSGNGSLLGVGCSDPYGSGLNGSQGGLGPRHEVNAFTGAFTWPFQDRGVTGDRAYKRIQIANDEINPSLHPSALFFGEAQYVAPDDAAAGNGTNNVSWRQMNRTGTQATGGAWRFSMTGSTRREQPAIYAWLENEPNTVNITEINVPGEGQFVAGSNVIDNLDGTYRYEYAIFNNNSDFSGQRFSIPVGTAATITDIGMSFPLYHSGEPYTNTPWTGTFSNGFVTWTSETFNQNPDGNALRWGTTYSFWFTANTPPVTKTMELGLFKPGNPGPQGFDLEGPMDVGPGGLIVTNYCTTNINSTGQTSKIDVSNIDMVTRTMDLEASDMPANQFGFFVTSLDTAFIPNAGNSSGNLCVGGTIGRFVMQGQVLNSGNTGSYTLPVDLDMIPAGASLVSVMAGETRFFQTWHRDVSGLGTQTSNFSDGLRITFP